MKIFIPLIFSSLSSFALAESTSPVSSTLSSPLTSPGIAFAKVILVLGFIVGFILLSAWLARRSGFINIVNKKNFQVVASVALSQKEKAVLLKVGKQHLLLGVAAGSVNTLHTYAENENPLEQEQPFNTEQSFEHEEKNNTAFSRKSGLDFSTQIKKLLTQGQLK